MKFHPIVVLLAGGLLLAACGDGSAPSVPRVPSEPPDAAPPAEQGDIDDLIAYGQEHVDEFGGLYIDPPGGTSVVMLFTANLEEHRAAVTAMVPGTRVRAVEHTEAELVALLESFDFEALAADGIEMVSGSVDVIGNRVELEVKANDPTVELRFELAHGGLLNVTVHPVPGEWANTTEGDGWRLVVAGEGPGTEAYTVRAATDDDAWIEMWEALALGAEERPPIDLADEVVVSFGHGIGSSCPELRLDEVRIQDGAVFSVTSDPLAPRACTADLAGAAVFVVALDRAALPAGGFTVRLSPERVTCEDCGFNEEVEVPLP